MRDEDPPSRRAVQPRCSGTHRKRAAGRLGRRRDASASTVREDRAIADGRPLPAFEKWDRICKPFGWRSFASLPVLAFRVVGWLFELLDVSGRSLAA